MRISMQYEVLRQPIVSRFATDMRVQFLPSTTNTRATYWINDMHKFTTRSDIVLFAFRTCQYDLAGTTKLIANVCWRRYDFSSTIPKKAVFKNVKFDPKHNNRNINKSGSSVHSFYWNSIHPKSDEWEPFPLCTLLPSQHLFIPGIVNWAKLQGHTHKQGRRYEKENK